MKIKNIVLASAVLVSVSAFAQKDELKKLNKIYSKDVPNASDLAEYKATLEKLKPLATAEADKVYYDFYRAAAPAIEIATLGTNATTFQVAKLVTAQNVSEMADAYKATLDYEKKTGKKVLTDDINEDIGVMRTFIVNGADSYAKAKKYSDASTLVYSLYKLDPKDGDMLFYAASYSVNAEDYDKALEYYNELKRINYSGETTYYFAINNTTKVEDNFGTNKSLRDLSVGSVKSHSKPREVKYASRRGEIYKNIALILVQKNRIDEAKTAIADARKENPDDTSLIISEADLYLKVKDYPNYTKLVNEALEKNPNNTDLIFNLGVISAEGGKLEEAEKYYKRAIEINPSYVNAYINLTEVKLRDDEKLVNEMNKLGTSDKEMKRYDALKKQREDAFKSVLPYLEKAVELEPTNESTKKLLLSVYGALEMTDKAKALKAKM